MYHVTIKDTSGCYKLMYGLEFEKKDIKSAVEELYNTLNSPGIGLIADRAVRNIMMLQNTRSNLNFPILVQNHLPRHAWTSYVYNEEMHRCIMDLKETIRSGRPYGAIKTYLERQGLSLEWLTNNDTYHPIDIGARAPMSDKVSSPSRDMITKDTTDTSYLDEADDPVEILGSLTGDFVRGGIDSTHTQYKGQDALLHRNHDPVSMPSLESVQEILADQLEDVDIEDHLLDEEMYEKENDTVMSALPDKPNPLGMCTEDEGEIVDSSVLNCMDVVEHALVDLVLPPVTSTAIRKNPQPIGDRGIAKILRDGEVVIPNHTPAPMTRTEHKYLSKSTDTSPLSSYTIDDMVQEIRKRLDPGMTIIIQGL